MENVINCPHCNKEINIKSALQSQVSGEVNAQYKHKYAVKHQEQEVKDAELLARENSVKEQELNKKSEEELFDSKVQEEVKRIMPGLEQEVGAKYSPIVDESAEMKKKLLAYEQKDLKDKRDEATREEELRLRDDKIRAEEAEKSRAQREKDKIAYAKELELKGLEGDERVKQMENTLQKGLSQAGQTSQQIQGEAGEISVENYLTSTYPCLLYTSPSPRDS